MNSGLEIITGCMFSGKSTELIKRINRHKLLDRKVLSITHASDNRYSSSNDIVTHDRMKTDAVPLTDLRAADVLNYDVICIEEAQFFDNLYNIVNEWVHIYNKFVIVCGLDGDFKAEPFIDILKLIPLADDIVKLHALCMDCKDGTLANFSKRINNDKKDERLLVGCNDMYKSVCRKHFYIK
jgi:thymidine kinase